MSGPNQQILLVERPTGPLELHHFSEVSATVPEPGTGEVPVPHDPPVGSIQPTVPG